MDGLVKNQVSSPSLSVAHQATRHQCLGEQQLHCLLFQVLEDLVFSSKNQLPCSSDQASSPANIIPQLAFSLFQALGNLQGTLLLVLNKDGNRLLAGTDQHAPLAVLH
uniref:Uncharacterized protein n=1 Tax=Opuntia streptacantha TaxID=393608 RepID=A0A7C9AC81_OPUST